MLNLSKKPMSFVGVSFGYFLRYNIGLSTQLRRNFSTEIENNEKEKNLYSMVDENDRIKNFLMYRYNKYAEKFSSNLLSHLLEKLYTNDDGIVTNETIQRDIENLILNEYDVFYSNNKREYMSSAINDKLVPNLLKYMMEKEVEFYKHIKRLKNYHLDNDDYTKSGKLIKNIFTVVDEKFMVNVCLSHLFLVHVYDGSDNDKQLNSIDVSITIGKKILNRYFIILKENYEKENDVKLSFSE